MSGIGHNSQEKPIMLENQFDEVKGNVSDIPQLLRWVNDEVNNIAGDIQYPTYYLNERVDGITIEGVIYINFGCTEVKLNQLHDGSFEVIEWLSCNGKSLNQAA